MKNCFSLFIRQTLTQSYLVKKSITHGKYLTPQLKEDNDPISAKSDAQILSLKPFNQWFAEFWS